MPEPVPPERRPSLDHPGDDSAPGYSHKRPAYRVPEGRPGSPDEPYVPYAELHVHSDFSFLDGASDPESLIEEAARLRLAGLALTDHDGFYAAARFAEAAKAYDLPTVYGAELSLGLTAPQNGVADPEGEHLLVLARGVEGYHRLSAAITDAQLRGDEKGRPVYDLDELAQRAEGHWLVLTGCRKGPLRAALTRHAEAGRPTRVGTTAAARALDDLVGMFGPANVAVEISDAGLPTDSTTNDVLAALAAEQRLPLVATGNVHFATPEERRLAAAMAAVRARRSLAEMDGWLPPPGAHLRSGHEMAQRFARYPGAVATSVRLAERVRLQPAAGQAPAAQAAGPARPHPGLVAARAVPPRAWRSATRPSATPSPGSGWSASSPSSRRRTSPATSSSSATWWPSPASRASSARAAARRPTRSSATC